MNDHIHVNQVGSPDPELNTSPIAEEFDEDMDVLRQEVPGEPVCLFNDISFPHGQRVCSGTALYRCDYGIWVREGGCDADNP